MAKALSIPEPMSRPLVRPGWLARPTAAVQALVGTSFVLAWVLLEWLTQNYLMMPGVSGWYLPAGVGVAVIWGLGWRYAWAVLVAAWLGQVLVWSTDGPITQAALVTGSMVTGAKVGAYCLTAAVLRRAVPALAALRHPSQAATVVLALLGCAGAAGVSGIGIKVWQGDSVGPSIPGAMLGWAVGDAIGLLVAAPLLALVVLPAVCRWTLPGVGVGVTAGGELPRVPGQVVWPLAWGFLVAGLVVGLYAWPTTRDVRVVYLGFAAVPVLALSYGLSGGLIALAVVNIVAVLAAGRLSLPGEGLLDMQLLMIGMALSAVFVGTASTLRRQAADTAAREQRWAALALRGGALGRWEWEAGTTHLLSDYAVTDRLGYPRHLVKHDTRWWRPKIHPDDEPARSASLQRCLSGEAMYHDVENRMLDAGGGWVWFHTQGRVLERDASGRATRIGGTHREITASKRVAELEAAAHASHQSERRFRVLADASPVGVFQTDAHGGFLYVNPAWTEATGLEMSDALYRHASAFAHAEDRDMVADHWATAAMLSAPLRCEMRLPKRKGHPERWLSMQATPISSDRGEPNGYVGTVVDVTTYREQVAMIADSEARYRTLAEHANDMLWRVRADDAVYTYVSPSAEALLGYTPEEFVGTDAYDYFHPEDVAQVRAKHAGMSPEHPEFINTHRYRRKDGEYIVLDAIGRLVTPDDPHEEAYIVGISRDVTQRVEAERQREELQGRLRQSQKLEALGSFAQGVAHDVRNTLLAINLSAQSAAKKLEPGHPAHRQLEIVEAACRQASDITQSLLTFARGQGASKARLDLRELLEASVRLLGAVLPRGVNVCLDLPAEPQPRAWVTGNRGELEQVLMNLARNAGDAMPGGGTLTLGLSIRGNRAVVTVADTGSGMPERVRRRVFEPFFTTKTRLKGTGLGLALVHGIIEDHAGTVTLDSTPGQGTTVTIELPLAEQADAGSTDDTLDNRPADASPEFHPTPEATTP